MADLKDGRELAAMLRYAADLISLGERVLALPDCNVCAKQRECEYVPGWGQPTRINCPLFVRGKEAKR